MIDITGLTISFEERVILDRISLHVAEGKIAVLLGKNGSGKSVLLKAAAGLIPHYRGDIRVNGRDLRDLLAYSGKKEEFTLAYVFQKGGLFDSLDVFQNVAFGLRRKGVREDSIADIVTGALGRVGLSGNEAKLPSELSGGMQKRVGLARAICMNPSVILYDDPTAGLDPILSDAIADLILEIKEAYRATSIVVTQDLKVAKKIADSVYLLYNAGMVFEGTRDEFFSGNNPYARQFLEGDIEGPIDIF